MAMLSPPMPRFKPILSQAAPVAQAMADGAQPQPAPAFVWGGNGEQLSPQDVARKRQIAEQMMQSGSDYSPVQSWSQGLARVAEALAGGLEERRANEADAANKKGARDQMAAYMAEVGDPTIDAKVHREHGVSLMDNPYLGNGGRAVLEQDFKAPTQPFAGQGFDASVANILVQGANNPAIRETPQYKLALADWQKVQMLPNAQGQMQIFKKDLPIGFADATAPQGAPPSSTPMQPTAAAAPGDVPAPTTIPGVGTMTTLPGTGKTPNEGQLKAGQYLTEGLFAAKTLDDPKLVQEYLGPGNSTMRLGGDWTEWLQSGKGQQYETAAKDWLGGFLYQKSGAQITPAEFTRSQSTYIPVWGDSPDRLAFKAQARAIAQQALQSGLTPAQRDQAVADVAKVMGQPVPDFGQEGAPSTKGGPPPEAIDHLRNDQDPNAKANFDAIFGPGAAEKALGGGQGGPMLDTVPQEQADPYGLQDLMNQTQATTQRHKKMLTR